MAVMTKAAYARHRKVSPEAVRRAIDAGRISVDDDGKIDSDRADIEWREHTRFKAASSKGLSVSGDPSSAESAYRSYRARTESAKAGLAELDLGVARGDMIERARAERVAQQTARTTRDKLLSLPSRIALELAVLTDPQQIEQFLRTHLRDALQDALQILSDGVTPNDPGRS